MNILDQITHMGLAESYDLPSDIDSNRDEYEASWTEENIKSNRNNLAQGETREKVESGLLTKISNLCSHAFITINKDLLEKKELIALDVYCGNMVTTAAMAKYWPGKWICTDIIDHFTQSQDKPPFEFERMTAPQAVAKYEADILVLAFPSPYSSRNDLNKGDKGYSDYFACADFVAKYKNSTGEKSPKYIMFLGELGAAEGSSGMHKYLHQFNLIHKASISHSIDMFGGDCDRILYVFKI